jgi:4-alpha-glucanotransferase
LPTWRAGQAAAEAGADALAISPTNALFPAAPERCSPYSPSSRDHLNILYADPSTLGAAPQSQPGGPDLIDWPSASAAKLARLTPPIIAFGGDPRFDDFIAAGGVSFAATPCSRPRRALRAQPGRGTLGGAGPRRSQTPRAPRPPPKAWALATRVGFFLFAQWLADLGLQRPRPPPRPRAWGLA